MTYSDTRKDFALSRAEAGFKMNEPEKIKAGHFTNSLFLPLGVRA